MKFKSVHNKEDAKGLFTEIVGEIAKPLRGYSDERIFYVYAHKRPTDGSVFYIGKGKKNRAWVNKSRNKHWQNVVDKHGGFEVEILHNELTEQDSFKLEREEILKVGIENLTNQTLGGISTTGFRHREETKELFRQITTDRLLTVPGLKESILAQLEILHEKQRNDPEYRKEMSRKMVAHYAAMSPEQMALHAVKTRAWASDPHKAEKARQKSIEHNQSPEARAKNSERMSKRWENMTAEQRDFMSKQSSSVINRPEVRAKLVEAVAEKIVVNKKFLFNSKRHFLDEIQSHHNTLHKAQRSALKFGFDFTVMKGYFIEEYSEEHHMNVTPYFGELICKLDFDCLPRSKAVVMDDTTVFLSMNEASMFCNGKTVEATADFITKNMKLGKTAFGHSWRKATNDELRLEILNRLERLNSV